MTKLAPVAILGVSMLLAACGGATKTVTAIVTVPSFLSTIKPVGAAGPGGLNLSAVAACLTAGGAHGARTLRAGPGTEVYAIAQDGKAVGAIKAPTATVARQIEATFAGGGYKTKPVVGDPTAFAISKGSPTQADSVLLSKCTT